MYKIYARVNDKLQVQQIFSNCFQEPQATDIFIKEGKGDEFVHVGYYEILDEQGLHNYKIADKKMVQCTKKDKQLELQNKPKLMPIEQELWQQQIEAGMAELAMQIAKNTLLGGN